MIWILSAPIIPAPANSCIPNFNSRQLTKSFEFHRQYIQQDNYDNNNNNSNEK